MYCQMLVGKYVRTLELFKEVNGVTGWEAFKGEIMKEYK